MCVRISQLDSRTRSIARIANLCLISGLILWIIIRPSIATSHLWIDGLCGLLFGFYITVNPMCFPRPCRGRTGPDSPATQNS